MPEQRNTTHRACVLTPGAVFYGDGSTAPLTEGLHMDLRAILRGVPGRFTPTCALVLDGVPWADLAGAWASLGADGWQMSTPDAWTHLRRDGYEVALGVRSRFRPTVHHGVLYSASTDPGALALLLDRYHQVTGYNWRGTAATTALNALRSSWGNAQYQPRWRLTADPLARGAGALTWSRELNEWEASWGYVHTFDANAAYLGSAISADVAFDELHHVGPQQFDERLPGYWHLALSTSTLEILADKSRPPLLSGVRNSQAWVTTPYAKLLRELGDGMDVIDSYTARRDERANGGRLHPAGARVLRTWGEQLRDARRACDQSRGSLGEQLRQAVKHTYKDAIGGMARTSRDGGHLMVYRPDWAALVIDLWRATLMRRIIEVHRTQGVWPVRVATDSIAYADCVANPTALARAIGVGTCELGCGCGGNPIVAGPLGSYHHEAVATTEQWQAAHKPRPPSSPRPPRQRAREVTRDGSME